MSEEKLYTVQEVASQLKMHPESVRRLIREDRLRAVRLGPGPRAKIRIKESDLKKFLS